MKNNNLIIKNSILGILVLIIGITPLIFNKKAEFLGTDDRATSLISQINSNYKPWFDPIWEPPSGEVESLFFALQAAIGAGFIGYFIGLSKDRKEK